MISTSHSTTDVFVSEMQTADGGKFSSPVWQFVKRRSLQQGCRVLTQNMMERLENPNLIFEDLFGHASGHTIYFDFVLQFSQNTQK